MSSPPFEEPGASGGDGGDGGGGEGGGEAGGEGGDGGAGGSEGGGEAVMAGGAGGDGGAWTTATEVEVTGRQLSVVPTLETSTRGISPRKWATIWAWTFARRARLTSSFTFSASG